MSHTFLSSLIGPGIEACFIAMKMFTFYPSHFSFPRWSLNIVTSKLKSPQSRREDVEKDYSDALSVLFPVSSRLPSSWTDTPSYRWLQRDNWTHLVIKAESLWLWTFVSSLKVPAHSGFFILILCSNGPPELSATFHWAWRITIQHHGGNVCEPGFLQKLTAFTYTHYTCFITSWNFLKLFPATF